MGNPFYVIVLDIDINDPNDWVYVAKRNTEPEIKAVTQYSSADRQNKSKAQYDGVPGESKNVVSIESGNSASGRIYQLSRRP